MIYNECVIDTIVWLLYLEFERLKNSDGNLTRMFLTNLESSSLQNIGSLGGFVRREANAATCLPSHKPSK